MPSAFIVEAVGGGNRKKHLKWEFAEEDLLRRMTEKQTRKWQLRKLGAKGWMKGQFTKPEARKRIREIMKDSREGQGMVIRGSEQDERRFRVIHIWIEPSKGSKIVQAAASQLGVEYKWAWADPRGDNDGASGFDCSGLTSWCYAQVGVQLPHSAYYQYRSGGVDIFHEKSKLKNGDLVFYDASSRANPDHVGIYAGEGKVIDASSYYDAVVRRDMDSNPIYGFGRVRIVNGAL